MYNNEVTYHDKWKTPENEAALKELERKYFSKSECSPDCPLAWAPEVLEMMNILEKELGFARNTKTMRGYYIQGNALDWFIVDPWKNAFNQAITQLGFGKYAKYNEKNPVNKVKKVVGSFFHSIGYGRRALVIKYLNPLLNRINKPKITLGQLKEKYGELTCYFHTSDAFEEFVSIEIRKCKVKIAMKGAGYPLENLWDAGVSYNVENKWHPDSVSVTYSEYEGKRTVSVKQTRYRKIMQDLGINLEELKQKIVEDALLKEKDNEES